jgi:hypothetical protein
MTLTKVKGIPVNIGGETYIVPPLSLGALEQLQDRITKFSGNVGDRDQIATVIDAAHAALRRNYPDISRETVADGIGLEGMNEVFGAVMDVSGIKRRALEAGADAAGEAEPGNSTTAS